MKHGYMLKVPEQGESGMRVGATDIHELSDGRTLGYSTSYLETDPLYGNTTKWDEYRAFLYCARRELLFAFLLGAALGGLVLWVL